MEETEEANHTNISLYNIEWLHSSMRGTGGNFCVTLRGNACVQNKQRVRKWLTDY